jgi:YfiH family protein
LNCSYGVGDSPENVASNLERVCTNLDLDPRRLVTVSQVHGATVVEYGEGDDVDEFHRVEADAVVSRSPRHGLAIRTADCLPILIACRTTGHAAAVHAGWRGVVAEVVARTVERLVELGSNPKALIAAIGPHIGVDAFEVSEDVAQVLQATAPECPAVARKGGDAKPHVALGRLAEAQLLRAGVAPEAIETVHGCTYSNERSFFSFRRDGKFSGRHVSVIRPR